MITIKVFLSSTFLDLNKERNFIKNVLIPSMSELFTKSVQISTIDLRWGITDSEITSGQLLSRCIEAIDDCEPFFICMLGSRYGSEITEESIHNYPEMLNRIRKLGYNLSATESEIAYVINKLIKGDQVNPYFIFIEEGDKSQPFAFLHKLVRKWKYKYLPGKLSNGDRLDILKEDIQKYFKDRILVCNRRNFEYQVSNIKHYLFKEITQYISSVTYLRYGNHSLQSYYFSTLLSLYTQSNPFYQNIKHILSTSRPILIFDNNLLLESAITKRLSEFPDDSTQVISYYSGPEKFHHIADNRFTDDSINSYCSIGNFWRFVNSSIASILKVNLKSPEFSEKAEVPKFKDLLLKYTKRYPNNTLIIYVSHCHSLKPLLKYEDIKSYIEGKNVRFIFTSKTIDESSTYKSFCTSLSNEDLYTFSNEYLYQRFEKKLQHQSLFKQLFSMPFIEITDIIFILHYLHHYTNHNDLYERLANFVRANDINEFYSYLIKTLSNDIAGFQDFLRFTSVANCIRLEVLSNLIPDFNRFSFYGAKEVLKLYMVCDASDTIMLTNERLRKYVLEDCGNNLESYNVRYYDSIRNSGNYNDIIESMFILRNINEKEKIIEYLSTNSKAVSYLVNNYLKQFQDLLSDTGITTDELVSIIHPIDYYDNIYTYHKLSTIFSNLKDYTNSYYLCKNGYEHCMKHRINVPFCIYALHLIQCNYMSKIPSNPKAEYASIINDIQTISSTWTSPSDLKMKKDTLEMAKQWQRLFRQNGGSTN